MASARPPLPAEVRAPPAAGQEGGSRAPGPSSSWEGAGKGRGAQRMCGSAYLPEGGAAPQPCPRPPQPRGTGSSGAPTPGGRGRSRGGAGARSKSCRAVRQAWPARAASLPAPSPRTPEPSLPPVAGGIPRVGGQCREMPRPLRFPVVPAWKLSHRRTPSPLPLAGRDPRQAPPTLLRQSTNLRLPDSVLHPPWGQFRSPRSPKPGPTFLLGVHGRSGTAPAPRSPPTTPPALMGSVLAPSGSGSASATLAASPRPVPAA